VCSRRFQDGVLVRQCPWTHGEPVAEAECSAVAFPGSPSKIVDILTATPPILEFVCLDVCAHVVGWRADRNCPQRKGRRRSISIFARDLTDLCSRFLMSR
jgi:hypothetical protein